AGEPGALQAVPRLPRAESDGRQVFHRGPERAEPGPHARQEDDVFMGTLGFHGGSSASVPSDCGIWVRRPGDGRARAFARRHTRYPGTPVAPMPSPMSASTARATPLLVTSATAARRKRAGATGQP